MVKAARFSAAMAFEIASTNLVVELGLIPTNRHLSIVTSTISWNDTTWLKVVFLAIAAALLTVFIRTGSWSMLSMMGGAPDHQTGESDVRQDSPKAADGHSTQ